MKSSPGSKTVEVADAVGGATYNQVRYALVNLAKEKKIRVEGNKVKRYYPKDKASA